MEKVKNGEGRASELDLGVIHEVSSQECAVVQLERTLSGDMPGRRGLESGLGIVF